MLFLSLALAWRLLLFVGPTGSDDLAYSEEAHLLSQGIFRPPQGIHGLRWGYTGVIALLYHLFGAGSFSLILFNLMCSLAELPIAWKIAREYLGERGADLATLLLALLPAHVFYASEAHPDVPLSLFLSLSILLVLKGRSSGRPRDLFLAGLALGTGHFFKETSFLGLLCLAPLMTRPRRRILWVLAGFFLMMGIESAILWGWTGDPLYRLRLVRTIQANVMGSDYYLRAVPNFSRLFLDLPLTMFWPLSPNFPYFGFLPLASIGGLAAGWIRKDRTLHDPALWSIGLILLMNFWPIHLIPYRPAMVLHARIFLIVAVPLTILAASLIRNLPSRLSGATAAGLLISAALASLLLHQDGRSFSAGARLAYDRVRSEVVVSDPRTIGLFRLYDGYRTSPRRLGWDESPPSGAYIKVINETWINLLREMYDLRPPQEFLTPHGELVLEATVPGRIRLRPLLTGRIQRTAPSMLRIFRMEGSPPRNP